MVYLVFYIFLCYSRVPVGLRCQYVPEHENHQTSNLNMQYSGEHNKRQCPDLRQTFAANRQRSQARATSPDANYFITRPNSRQRTSLPLQTTVSYGIILSDGHKSTATSAKRRFNTHPYCTPQNYRFIGSRQEPCSPLPPPLPQFPLCTELPLFCWHRWRRGEP